LLHNFTDAILLAKLEKKNFLEIDGKKINYDCNNDKVELKIERMCMCECAMRESHDHECRRNS
jgi:hypothetical protein